MQPDPKKSPATVNEGQPLQGEGNYEAARRYRESVKSFVDSGQVEAAAGEAAPKTAQEQQDLIDAEKVGESHSKGEDPASKHSPPRVP